MFGLALYLFLFFNVLDCVVSLGVMLGQADLLFKSQTECEPPLHLLEFRVTQRKYNRTVNVLDIIVNTPYDIGDDLTIELKSSVKKQGGFKPGGFYMKEPACKALSTMIGDVFMDILRAAGVEKCPLPAGNHEILGYYLDNEKFTIPQIYGEYKTEFVVYKDEEKLYCSFLYFDMAPKS